jgi:membrane dipeptidase
MLLFDAHLDLAMNAMEWNRDLTLPLDEVRMREKSLTDKPDRGRGTVSFGEMRKGSMGLCVATLIARYVKSGNPLPGWHSPAQAWAQTQGQLAWYRAMEKQGQLFQITNLHQLNSHVQQWQHAQNPHTLPIGYILSLEGADSIMDMQTLEQAWAQGLRAIGPAHYGPGTYAQGTHAQGGIGALGRELLKRMEQLGMILDVTHLCDESLDEAMDHFHGYVWASHSNCRALVHHDRQFSDEQLVRLLDRGAVVGVALDAWMLTNNWVRGVSTPALHQLSLQQVADHIDHICQLAGNSLHAGIGSDLDGGFGTEQGPGDVDSIADLQKLTAILKGRGYTNEDLANVMHANWLRFLRKAWSGDLLVG